MTNVQMSYAGAAPELTVQADIGPTDTSFSAAVGGTASGYPDGSAGKFVVLIGGSEKILCSSRSGTTFTVATAGRGYDGTAAATWITGSTVTHDWDAASAQMASDHVNDKTNTHAYVNVANTFTSALNGFGAGSGGAASAFTQIGDDGAGSAVVQAGHGTGPDANLRLIAKGAGIIRIEKNVGATGSTNNFGAGAVGAGQGFTAVGDDGAGNGVVRAGHGTVANAKLLVQAKGAGQVQLQDGSGNAQVLVGTSTLGFHGTAPVAKQTVTGSQGGNAALADLLTKLAAKGLLFDGTTA